MYDAHTHTHTHPVNKEKVESDKSSVQCKPFRCLAFASASFSRPLHKFFANFFS